MTNRSFSTIAVVVVFAALIVSPASVHADSASSFIATGGSGSLVNLGGGEGSMLWTLTGPSLSFTLAGDINVPQCNLECVTGNTFSASTALANFGGFFGSGTLGGTFYRSILFTTGSIDITSGTFTISGVNPTFAGPVVYSGGLEGCVPVDGLDCENATVFIDLGFAPGGTFTAKFSGPDPSGFYNLSSGTYTFAAPEPGSLALFSSGLVAIAGLLRRKRLSF